MLKILALLSPCITEQKGQLSYCRGFLMKEKFGSQTQDEKEPSHIKLNICSSSLHLKKKTKSSSFQSHHGKDLPIVTRTHWLAGVTSQGSWFSIKSKRIIRNVMLFQKWNWGKSDFAYKSVQQVLCFCKYFAFLRPSFYSLHMVSLLYPKGSSCTCQGAQLFSPWYLFPWM